MSKHDRKLNLLTGIPADLIELCATQRFKLLAKQQAAAATGKKKPFFPKKALTVAIAAVLLLTVGLSAFFLLFGNGKQIPVYQGMTVSSEAPVQLQASPFRHFTLFDTVSPEFALLAHKEEGWHDNSPNQNQTAADGSALDPESGAALYYAKQNEDFYITVHIDNPDKFEILSFTLNGEKYSSYMFEPGSDMENLILKCNVGDASGIVEYTIDAIKYVDGTEIKDVRMDGDRTVKVGVYTEQQPTAGIVESEVGFGEIGVDVTINDPKGITSLLASEAYAILYKDGAVVDRQAVSITAPTSVRFTGLDDGAQYHVAVIANYDAFDGAGKVEHTIGERTCTTPAIVKPQASGVSYTEAVAKLDWNNGISDQTAVSFALYKGGEKIRNLSGNEVKLTGLLSGTEYTLKVEYTHNGAVRSREVTFTTETVDTPTLAISEVAPDLHSVSCKLKETDPLDLLTVDKILLKQGDAVVATATGTAVEFTDLELLQTYTVEVTYSYDLMDGSGKQTKFLSTKVATQSKGLKVENGVVVGIGSCTDTKIYVNMPIGDNAFKGAPLTEVVMGSGVTSIGELAFAECAKLKKVSIPEGITTLSSHLFEDCVQLAEINFPDSLTEIGDWVFSMCKSLENVTLPDGLKSIGETAFGKCAITELIIPNSVTEIGNNVFEDCEQLKEIVFPDSVTKIPSGICYDCSALEKITLPKGLISIGQGAFGNCAIRELIVPDGVTEIGGFAFYDCNLENLTLPDGLLTIGEYAFAYSAIDKLIIPSSVIKIGEYAFLSSSITICFEAPEEPAGWDWNWDGETAHIIWNFKEFKTDSQGVTYALKNDGTAEVVGYNGNASTIRLEVEGYRTTKIARNAFHDNPAFHDAILIIPASVETLAANTFEADYGCTIYCEAPEKPAGWHDDWSSGKFTVVWGYTGS